VQSVLTAFLGAAGGQLAGMDVVGDWSPVQVQGGLRRLMHVIMHPPLRIDPASARRQNVQINLALLDLVSKLSKDRTESGRNN
jgi:hypothetical protein